MSRLRRRSGVLLASLGVAISALLVAPVSTAPAQAADPNYDNHDYVFSQNGSWWYAAATNCFTTNLEYLKRLEIWNFGSQPHKFRWKWQTYNGGVVAWEQKTWVVIQPGEGAGWQPAPNTTFGALLQSGHPRVKIYWVNNSGHSEVLFELHGWSPSGYQFIQDNGSNNGDCSGPP